MHRSERSLAAKLLPAALLLLQLLAWAAPSHAHGYMNIPASRNVNKWRGWETWRATMGNGIGPNADLRRSGNPSE
jgi:predicted carbohydrate-binding protein with CBM5 and CBM33 domain